MFSRSSFIRLAAALGMVLATSCALEKQEVSATSSDGKPVNPHPPGTYEHFKAEPSYPKTYTVWKNEDVLTRTDASNSHIVINLAKQRGFLMNGDEVAVDYPICSGTRSHPTPKGVFPIMEKIVDKSSNKYGRIYDADGKLVNSDADSTKHTVPEGGRFQGASMRYWMRMTGDGVGHHIGPVRRYPASHACVRGPSGTMPLIYSKVKVGTKIIVE
jgi:hypothetical protein